ncbi:MAG: hypothetical protein EP310_06020 [Bacteroidetes bacterium]|nr:MAG: hypothetical protein EP310_06020 [Bacteroidota bacterium]
MNKIFGIIILSVFGFSAVAQVKMKKQEGGFLFTENNENVLFYQKYNKNIEGKYQRCNYIHPLWGIDGTVLTEDFPADHLHHRGIFWAWHQVFIGDKSIGDPWEIKDFEQEITDIEYAAKGAGIAELKTEVLWKSPLWRNQGEKVPYIREKTKIAIHPKAGNHRRIDFEIQLFATAENLKIGGSADEKGYSGFSVRMVLPEDVRFLGPQGEITPEINAVKSPGYVNVTGSVGKNGSNGGIVMVDHPENPDFPQPWILRKKNSMQNAAFPGNKLISVSSQRPLFLRYSLIVYSGKMSDKKIRQIIK